MDLKTEIKQITQGLFEEIKSIREHLHAHPELSFKEFQTSKFLKNKLAEWGIQIDKEWVDTGFTVVIDSGRAGKTIGLRADLDALPIKEQNEKPYASKNEGIMHACGHDVHSACLMGVAKLLNQYKEMFSGKVVLIFQPGEEKLPGGASLMIKEGLLEYYKFDAILAQHVYPELESGKVGFKGGMYMASADEIYLTVKGKGGHAALPHKVIDPIVIASSIILNLQQIVSRNCPPTLPAVLSFGKIIGEGATNVIPSEVKIEGTLRTMDETWRSQFHKDIESIATNTAKSLGGECDCDIKIGYPFLTNDTELTGQCKGLSESFLGAEQVIDLPLRMTAEDFSYFSQNTKVCFYRLGVRNEQLGIIEGVHHPKFDIDQNSLETAVGLMSFLAMSLTNPSE